MFDENMYRVAMRTFRGIYPLYLSAAIILTVLDMIGLYKTSVSMVAYGFAALFAHRVVILNEAYGWAGTQKGGTMPPLWSFLWRYIIFYLTYVVLVLAPMLLLLDTSKPATEQAVPLFLALAIGSFFMGLVLSAIGTALPAAATGGNASVRSALRRGRMKGVTTLVRLATGPAIAGIIAFVVVFATAPLLTNLITGFATSVFTSFLNFLPLHLTAVALSMTYSETEPGLDPIRD